MKKIYSLLLLVPFIALPAYADQCSGTEWTESKTQYILEIPKNGNPERFQCQRAEQYTPHFLCDNGVKVFLDSGKIEDKVGNSFWISNSSFPAAEAQTEESSANNTCTVAQKINTQKYKFAPNQNADENIVIKFYEVKTYSGTLKAQPQF